MTPAQQQIVLDHMHIASEVARKIKPPPRVERIDIYQSARYGLCLAASKARPGKPFPAFARLVIKQTIIHDLRHLAFQIRSKRRFGVYVNDWPSDDFEPRWIVC